MQQPPRPRRGRPRRRPPQRPRPTQAPAEPRSRAQPPAPRAPQRRPDRARPERQRGERSRRGRGRPRAPAAERTGTAAVILLDNREGEPDLTGAAAVFEGYFDPETGERRRPDEGVARLKVGNERIWGPECWWRLDPAGSGLTPEDHAEIEASKRLLRGLIREARRPAAFARAAAPKVGAGEQRDVRTPPAT